MSIRWTIVEVTVNFVEIGIIYYFLSSVLVKKYSDSIILGSAIFTGAVFSVINHYNIQNPSGIASVSIYLIIYISIFLLYKDTGIKKLLVLLIAFLIIMLSDFTIFVLMRVLICVFV